MPDETCFKFTFSEKKKDLREIRKYVEPYGRVDQVYSNLNSLQVVFVKYKTASSAEKAKTALMKDNNIVSVEPVDTWPYLKRSKTSVQQQRDSQESGDLMSVTSETFSEHTSDIRYNASCSFCSNSHAEFVCSTCSAWYCSERCQLKDWVNHKMICIPRLIRVLPALRRNLVEINANMAAPRAVNLKATNSISKGEVAGHKHGNQSPDKENVNQWQQVLPEKREKEEKTAKPTTKLPPNKAQLEVDFLTKPPPQLPDKPQSKEDFLTKPPQQFLKLALSKDNLLTKPPPKLPEKIQAKDDFFTEPPPKLPEKVEANHGAGAKMTPKLPETKPEKPLDKPSLSSTIAKEPPEKQAPKSCPPVATANEQLPPTPTVPEPASKSSMLMKRMQQRVGTPKRTLSYGPFPGPGSKVLISFVSDAKTIFIHEVANPATSSGPVMAGTDPYMQYLKRSVDHAKEVKELLLQPPAVNDIVFALYEGYFYRAVVRKIDGDNVTVFFTDFGNEHTLPWKTLKAIPNADIKYAPCLVHCVEIAGGVPFTPAIRTFLDGLIEQALLEVISVDTEQPGADVKVVDLRHVEGNYALSAKLRELLANEGQAGVQPLASKLIVPDPANYQPVFGFEFSDPCIPEKKSVAQLMIVEASDLIEGQRVAAILTADHMSFGAVLKECSQYGTQDPNPYVVNELSVACLAQYDETWSRALKIGGEAGSEKGEYYLFDLGLIRTLDKTCSIRRYPATLSRKLYCAEYVVDNPTAFSSLLKDNEEDAADMLRGKIVKAEIYMDADNEGLFHMNVLSIV